MTDKELFDAIERLARFARASGKGAKRRESHLYVAKVLFFLLAVMAIDMEKEFAERVGKYAEKMLAEYNRKSVNEHED